MFAAEVTLSVAILPVIVTFDNVVVPVTSNVLATVADPFTFRSSNPIASSMTLPDTVRSPEIVVLPFKYVSR